MGPIAAGGGDLGLRAGYGGRGRAARRWQINAILTGAAGALSPPWPKTSIRDRVARVKLAFSPALPVPVCALD
jgi:hypothetical protein